MSSLYHPVPLAAKENIMLSTTSSRAPLFPVVTPSTKTAAGNLKDLETVCHVVEIKGEHALIHASPQGVIKITDLGLPVFHSNRGGEYYAVLIGVVEQSVLPRGTKIELRGGEYFVFENAPKRKQDLRRFEIAKDGGKTYVVSFQAGDAAQCSCPDWIYRRRQCKHITGIKAAVNAAQPSRRAA